MKYRSSLIIYIFGNIKLKTIQALSILSARKMSSFVTSERFECLLSSQFKLLKDKKKCKIELQDERRPFMTVHYNSWIPFSITPKVGLYVTLNQVSVRDISKQFGPVKGFSLPLIRKGCSPQNKADICSHLLMAIMCLPSTQHSRAPSFGLWV